MRLIPSLFAVLATLAALTGCGTKTPLTLPPPAQPTAKTAVPPAPSHQGIPLRITSAVDHSNKAAAETQR